MKNEDEVAALKAKQEEIHERIRELAKKNGAKDKNICTVLDGVGEIEEYLQSDPKIMWILRGPYDDDPKECHDNGYHEYKIWDCWEKPTANLPTWTPLIYILHAVRHHFESGERIELCDMHQIDDLMLSEFKGTAYINICKTAYEHEDSVEKSAEPWKEIVLEQIALYNPDIIIFGGTYDILKKWKDFDKGHIFIEHTPTESMAHIYKDMDGKKILFNAYHPSYVGGYRKDLMDWYVDEIADRIYAHYKDRINPRNNEK